VAATHYAYYEEQFTNCAFKLGSLPVVNSGIEGNYLTNALTKARGDAASQINSLKVNLAQAFGERRQTANLLADTATRIYMAVRAVKRADLYMFINATGLNKGQGLVKHFDRVNKTPLSKRLATHWLELQYGWKPLLQDAYGVANWLASHVADDRFHHRVTGRGVDGYTNVIPMNYPNPEQVGRVKIRARIGLEYRLDSQARAALAQTGIDNPALLAWELLPFSFVVDWFYPVGNYLEALNSFAGFDFVSGWQSRRTTWEGTVTYGGKGVVFFNASNARLEYNSHYGSYYFNSYAYQRDVLSSLPGALPPSFKNPIGGDPATRLWTALALTRQLFRS
jgi:hypothetical protein